MRIVSHIKCGFTLAEVLITLGIIGVVAAMTIHTLINKTNEKEMKTAWKKNYSIIQNAYNQVKYDEGGDLTAYFSTTWGTIPLAAAIGDYLYYYKTCKSGTYSTWMDVCNLPTNIPLASYYKTLSGGYLNENNLGCGQYILKDGTQLYFRTYNQGYLLAWIDVNGAQKKPNIVGRDLFAMLITKDKILPLGAPGTGVDSNNGCSENAYPTCPNGSHCGGDFAGVGCSAKYLYE